MGDLALSKSLVLPEHFATEGVVCTGMRGSGKSNTLVRWFEVLYENGIPAVAVDPKGDWWGIKSSADGKKPGLSVPIFGGLHEDFPLTEHLGAQIADLLVDQNMSAVLDVSRLSHVGRARFIAEFCNRLMDRHQVEPHVRCVILEEAHRYIPQQIVKGSPPIVSQCKEAASALLLEGRSFGIGCWAATQRPARLHKDVLEEVSTVFIYKVGAAATNDRKTIKEWLSHENLGPEIMESLTSLLPGEGWLLSPSDFDIVRRVRVDRRKTYDTGATPLVGAGSRPTLTLADVDSAAIKDALAETIEQAKANDPKELKAEVARLTRSLTDLMARTESHRCPEVPAAVEEVEVVPDWVPALAAQVKGFRDRFESDYAALLPVIDNIAMLAAKEPEKRTEVRTPERTIQAPQSPPPQVQAPARKDTAPVYEGDVEINSTERDILRAMAQNPEGLVKGRLCILIGKSWTGTMRTYLSHLRSTGCIVGDNGSVMSITDAGLEVLGPYDPLPTGSALREHWLANGVITGTHKDLFKVILAAYPDRISGEEATSAIGKQWSGTIRTYLSKLRTLGVIEGANASMRASEHLFD